MPCPEDKSRFIESLDQLESVPSDTKILKTAEDLPKSYEASHDGKLPTYPGLDIGLGNSHKLNFSIMSEPPRVNFQVKKD